MLQQTPLPVVMSVHFLQWNGKATYSIEIDHQLGCFHEEIRYSNELHTLSFLFQMDAAKLLHLKHEGKQIDQITIQ